MRYGYIARVSLSGSRQILALVTRVRDPVALCLRARNPLKPTNASLRTLCLAETEDGLGSDPRAEAGDPRE
jgi:hypothetical protein